MTKLYELPLAGPISAGDWLLVSQSGHSRKVSALAVAGPQGEQGPQGPAGPVGATGPQGEPADPAESIHAATSKTTPVDADELGLSDSAASWGLKKLTFANLKAVLLAYFKGQFREKLTAERTYYVRADGSDSNNGLVNNSGGAFLTIQKAIDVASALDNGGFAITIQVGAGAYTGANILKSFLGSGVITILGDATTPHNCVISATGAHCFAAIGVLGTYSVKGFKLQTTTSGSAFGLSGGSLLTAGAMDYGACAAHHILCEGGASFTQSLATYSISGGAPSHVIASGGGRVSQNVNTVTLIGTPAFPAGFAYADNLALVRVVGNSYTGAATGPRYFVGGGSVIDTNGGGTTYLPGDAAGSGSIYK